MTRGTFQILVDANNDPEFTVYLRNMVKEYLKDLNPDVISGIVSSLVNEGKPQYIRDIIRTQVENQIAKILPNDYWSRSKSAENLIKVLDELIKQYVEKRVDQILSGFTDEMIQSRIDAIIATKVDKIISNSIRENIKSKVNDLLEGV